VQVRHSLEEVDLPDIPVQIEWGYSIVRPEDLLFVRPEMLVAVPPRPPAFHSELGHPEVPLVELDPIHHHPYHPEVLVAVHLPDRRVSKGYRPEDRP